VITQRTDDVTLEGWVRWDGGDQPQAAMYNGSTGIDGYGFYVMSGLVWLNVGGAGTVACQSCKLVPGVWAELAAVRSDSTWTIYQNGAPQQASNTKLAVKAPSGAFWIASNSTGGDRLIGALDEVRVWDVARTAQQIAAYDTVSLAGDEPGLIAYYRMDDGSGSIVDDSAGDRPIALSGAPSWFTSGALLATAQR
jgi:hypothetical protein